MPHRAPAKSSIVLLFSTLILALLLAAVTVMNRLGADRWWFGALNLYLPQVIWASPGILLTAAMALVNRRLLWLPLLCVVWVLVPLMGLTWSRQSPPKPGQTSLRIMSCNVKYGARDLPALLAEMDQARPDVVLFQDATGLINSRDSGYFRDWDIRYYGQYVIASRLPLEEAEVQWLTAPGRGRGEGCLRCRLRIAGTPLTLFNVHLQSPRDALSLVPAAVKNPRFRDFVATRLAASAEFRYDQAEVLTLLLRQETGAVIVAGDLNSPDASRVCATLREAGLHDAFTQGGRGYGYTYGHFVAPERAPFPRFSFVRIDHIMMSSQLRAVRCWTGTAAASDHRPVYADLIIKPFAPAPKQ